MKRINLSLLFWLLLFAFQNVAAAEVEVKRAQKYAVEFMAAMGGEGFTVKETECVSKDGNAVYYIINMAPEGWVLVSAQDGVKPLLGYNMEGSYVNDPGMTNLAGWMDYYCRQITDAVKYPDLQAGLCWISITCGRRRTKALTGPMRLHIMPLRTA